MKHFILLIAIALFFQSDDEDIIKRFQKKCDENKVTMKIYNDPLDLRIAFFYSVDESIYINKAHQFFTDPAKFRKIYWKNKAYSTDDKDHFIIHEIGHVLLYRRYGQDKFLNISKINLAEKVVTSKVSRYAYINSREFFSEVYAGLILGKKYSNDIIEEYNRIWNY